MEQVATDVRSARESSFAHPAASHMRRGDKPTVAYSPEEQVAVIEEQWGRGGHSFAVMFNDQGIDEDANEIVAEFVRRKIRSIVNDPEVAEALCPFDHPIGTRRLILDSGYYETFNLPHVTLVNLRAEPLETITESGIRTAKRGYELDLIIFATGFQPFVGHLDAAHITNALGEGVTDGWKRGRGRSSESSTRAIPESVLSHRTR